LVSHFQNLAERGRGAIVLTATLFSLSPLIAHSQRNALPLARLRMQRSQNRLVPIGIEVHQVAVFPHAGHHVPFSVSAHLVVDITSALKGLADSDRESGTTGFIPVSPGVARGKGKKNGCGRSRSRYH